MRFWDMSILKEYVNNLQHTCNRTDGEKKFTCDSGFRTKEGTCLIKWDCGLDEYAESICPSIQYIPFATTIPSEFIPLWLVAMIVLTFSIT